MNRVRVLKKKSSSSNGGIFELNEVVLKDAVAAKGYTDPSAAKFEKESPVLVLLFKNDIIALSTISKLYKAFPDQEEELKKFVKKNKMRKNNPEKLNDLLSYMEDTMK